MNENVFKFWEKLPHFISKRFLYILQILSEKLAGNEYNRFFC